MQHIETAVTIFVGEEEQQPIVATLDYRLRYVGRFEAGAARHGSGRTGAGVAPTSASRLQNINK
jgi:hypothetical protein